MNSVEKTSVGYLRPTSSHGNVRPTLKQKTLNEELPNKHRNHEIEKLSERHFTSLFPIEWVSNSFKVDYGTDFNCEIVKNRGVTGLTFSVQLKGKEKEKNEQHITISNIKRSTINRWLNKLEPTLLIVYIVDENESYWKWFENDTVDLTSGNKTFSIQLTRENKLSKIDWKSVESYVTEIFSKRYLIHDFPTNEKANEKAWSLFFDRDIEKALPLFQKIAKKKNDALIWNAIAICEYELFNYQKALISINKALEIKEDSKILQHTKAAILTEQGAIENNNSKIESAIVIFKELIEGNFITDSIFYNYASALIKFGDYHNSIPEFKKAIIHNPNKPELWNNLGFVYMTLGMHKLEMECYDKALLLNPNQPETLFTKGSSLFRHFGEVDKGLELMLKASKKTNRYEFDFPYLYFWISEAYIKKGLLDEAVNWNKKGLDIFSTDEYLLDQNKRIADKKVG